MFDVFPVDAGARIEIDPQFVRVIQIGCTHWMGMQLNASKVDDPREARGVIDHELLGRPAGWERECDRAQPGRTIGRRAFLIEGLALSAVHKSLENDRTTLNAKEGSASNGQVITDDIEFGELDLPGEIELFRMSDSDLAPLDGEHLSGFF